MGYRLNVASKYDVQYKQIGFNYEDAEFRKLLQVLNIEFYNDFEDDDSFFTISRDDLKEAIKNLKKNHFTFNVKKIFGENTEHTTQDIREYLISILENSDEKHNPKDIHLAWF